LYKKLDREKDFISNLNEKKNDFRKDNHPNQSGHNKIADIILNNINITL
jgi:predicted nucleic acid-binding protein